MKINQNKSKISTIALILLLTISAIIVALPAIDAQETVTRQTFAYINANPNPAGVGQEVLLHIGITHPLQLATLGWEGLTVTVVDPEGIESTIGPIRTDATGGTGRIFTPTKVGTYLLQTNFPEQTNPATTGSLGQFPQGGATPEGATMLASTSEELSLVVQQDPIVYHPGFPLPTEYWTRPIDAQLREWYTISANWITTGWGQPPNLIAPYNDDAPETAHILWAKPFTIGGLVGGFLGDPAQGGVATHSFEIGDAYEGKFGNKLIIGGKAIYRVNSDPERADVGMRYVSVDLHTGEELWSGKVFLDNRTLSFGQLMYWDTYDFHGVYEYLWITLGSTWYAFDSYTGDLVYTLTDVPGVQGTPNMLGDNKVYGPKGEILIYTVNQDDGWMTLWNSTSIIDLYGSTDRTSPGGLMGWGQWRPFGKTVNATGPTTVTPNTPLGLNGYMWNKTIPTNLPGSVYATLDDRIVGASFSTTEVTSWAISIKPGIEGTLLFKETWTPPASWAAGNQSITFEAISSSGEGGVFVLGARDARRHYGFSIDTGEFLWETDSEIYLNWYGIPRERPPVIAYGKMMASGIAGTVYAYDIETGDRVWTYNATDRYSEFLFNINWWLYPLFITDGKIYYGHLEHSPVDPRPRGGPFIALNVENGDLVWRADGLFRQSLWGGRAIIGDSIILTQDTYDQRVYAIGKGPSATTATASPKVSVHGSSVLIEGTVMDVSPGTNDLRLTLRFANGVPAISDESMSDWMLYVYKQFPRPAAATGVTVTLETIDPNGNYQYLGTATTDTSGNYGFTFEPEVPGQYMILATFYGSNGYYGSTTTTYLAVDPAPAPAPAQPIEPEEPAPLITTELAIILVVVAAAVIGIVVYLLLRKRK